MDLDAHVIMANLTDLNKAYLSHAQLLVHAFEPCLHNAFALLDFFALLQCCKSQVQVADGLHVEGGLEVTIELLDDEFCCVD